MTKKIKAVIIVEGEFEGVKEFDSQKDADIYADGFGNGASYYGAGSYGVYTHSDWEDADDDEKEIIKEHIGAPPGK